MAGHAAAADWAALRRTLRGALLAVVALAIPALIGLLIPGRFTIRILFEHGESDAAAGALTYRVLRVYALALPGYVATEVITRGLTALRDTRTPLLTNAAQLAARAAIVALFLDRHSAIAIPVAFAVSASVETPALGVVLWRMLHVRAAIGAYRGVTKRDPSLRSD